METREGKLEIVGGLSFLNPSRVQLVMRDTPAGGTFDQRAAGATAFLVEVVKANDGDQISVTGSPKPEPTMVISAPASRPADCAAFLIV
jgi:hypothetical protein